MKLSEEALLLLANAEGWIYNHRCWRCIHYQEGIFPGEAQCFVACSNGRRSCGNYKLNRTLINKLADGQAQKRS